MEIKLDFTKSAQENAQIYFEKSKKAKRKAEGAERAIKDLEAKLAQITLKKEKTRQLKRVEKKEWYEKFHWFFTSNGMLVIGGNSAEQNELLNNKYFLDNDLFFHADIFGAGLIVLKEGVTASHEAREEAAQFAACFSKAWPDGLTAVNVYCLKRDQVSKSSQKGYLGKGSFLLSGEREWFKGTSLELCIFAKDKEGTAEGDVTGPVANTIKVQVAPLLACKRLGIPRYVLLKPGKTKKSDAAKYVAKELGCAVDDVMQLLPAGDFSTENRD